jgi:transposase
MAIAVNEVRVKRTQKDYSLAFKLSVVDEVEKGYLTYTQAQGKYGIQGRSTVLKWLRKHGREDYTNGGGNMSFDKTPYHQIKELEKQIKKLNGEKEVLNMVIDIADSDFNTNIRKKYLPESYRRTKNKGLKNS